MASAVGASNSSCSDSKSNLAIGSYKSNPVAVPADESIPAVGSCNDIDTNRAPCSGGSRRSQPGNEVDPEDLEAWWERISIASSNRFEKELVIGRGTYGVVFKVKDKMNDNNYVALKYARNHSETFFGVTSSTIREVSLLKNLKHNNIVKLKDEYVDEYGTTLVLEYLETSLRKFIEVRYAKKSSGLFPPSELLISESLLKSFMYQIMSGLAYMHSKGVMHRDLKPDNVLLNRRGELKICDFGFSRKLEPGRRIYTQNVATLPYRAPEVILSDGRYSVEVDLWSCGCIMAELARGKIIFLQTLFPGKLVKDQSAIATLFQMCKWIGPPEDDFLQDMTEPDPRPLLPRGRCRKLKEFEGPNFQNAKDFLFNGLLVYNPAKRLTAAGALNHPFLKREDFGVFK